MVRVNSAQQKPKSITKKVSSVKYCNTKTKSQEVDYMQLQKVKERERERKNNGVHGADK